MLVNDEWRAAGVIDWGDLCRVDPAVDLGVAYRAFSGRAREAFFAAYGPVDHECELRARVLSLFLCATLAEYAAEEGRGAWLRESLRGLARAVYVTPG